ncbi:unnamed protein product [Parnassius apollo]|uniref:(apollo) hypothetical protein n=1 Tax=Parnassius apollo TaxID=110799 RepID=A0A8S3XC81_PARAO|nr:unnamed protein product [Parnassius apollo]
MCARFIKVCIFILMCAGSTFTLKVIFERIRITYLNEELVQYAFVNVSRYERKGDYYINFEFITKYPFSKSLMIHLLFYEYVSYRYERSFIEFHYNLCDFLTDPLIGAEFKKRGLECPIKPGKLYSYKNFTVYLDDFPNVFPYEKGLIKFEITLMGSSNNTPIAEAFLHLSFKNRNKATKKNLTETH